MSVQNVAIDVVSEVLPVPTAFEAAKDFFFSNPLFNRISDWKIIMMDCSTIIAITCAFMTFVSGTTILCAAMTTVAIASAVGAFYMRQFVVLGDLQETARRFTDLAHNLEGENAQLIQTNQELLQTKDELLQEITKLNTSNDVLSKQVTRLALQADALSGSAIKIRKEMEQFNTQNLQQGEYTGALKESLEKLDLQISNSTALCNLISDQMSEKQLALGQEMTMLRKYLEELRSKDSVSTKIQELEKLHKALKETTQEINIVKVQFSEERGNFEGLRGALQMLREKFNNDIGEAAKDIRTSLTQNNQDFRASLTGLEHQMQAIAVKFNLQPNASQGRSKASTLAPIRSSGNVNPLFIA